MQFNGAKDKEHLSTLMALPDECSTMPGTAMSAIAMYGVCLVHGLIS